MPTDNQILTPTYQAPLIEDLKAVMRKSTEATPQETWKALKTLYYFMPPECMQDTREITDTFKAITEELNRIANSETIDPLFRDLDLTERQTQYLAVNNLLFLEVLKNSLFKHGYLKCDFTVKPAYGSGKF